MSSQQQSPEPPDDLAVFVISVAAELVGVHPQTLRLYERRGLVRPKRSTSSTSPRRYSARDIDRLREIQDLTGKGVNLAGVRRGVAGATVGARSDGITAAMAQALWGGPGGSEPPPNGPDNRPAITQHRRF